MLIAIDYDDTYTADPELWKPFLLHAKARGHSVICVTSRCESDREEVDRDLGKICADIVFTAGEQKRPFAHRRGYDPKVWIDDMPEAICSECELMDDVA